MTERQWTVSAEEPVLAVPHWTDPAVALKVAERTGETIWTRPGTGARWIRARLQPSGDSDRANAEREHRRQHPSSPLATSVHAALEVTGMCKPGQCAYVAAQLLTKGWPADPKAPSIRVDMPTWTGKPLPEWMDAQMSAYARAEHPTGRRVVNEPAEPAVDEPETGRAYAPKTITFGSMPDVTVTGVVRYDEPAGIQCPMPHCPESLTLEYTTSHTLGSGDLYSAPGGPEDGEARTWEVVCAAGHVILLPQDDSGGYCTFDDTDRDRLRDTLRWLAAGRSLMTKGS